MKYKTQSSKHDSTDHSHVREANSHDIGPIIIRVRPTNSMLMNKIKRVVIKFTVWDLTEITGIIDIET